MYHPPPPQKKNSDRIRTRKAPSFISFFMTGVNYLHSVLPQPLIFNLSYLLHVLLDPHVLFNSTYDGKHVFVLSEIVWPYYIF